MKKSIAALSALVAISSFLMQGRSDEILETSKTQDTEFLSEQKEDCDWVKLTIEPQQWLHKEIVIEGWISVAFGASNQVADVYLYDSSESCALQMRRRSILINPDDFLKAIEVEGLSRITVSTMLHRMCVQVHGTFEPVSPTYHLGALRGAIQVKVLPGQPVSGTFNFPDRLRKDR